MSFFKELKDDVAQSVNELNGEFEQALGEQEEEVGEADSDSEHDTPAEPDKDSSLAVGETKEEDMETEEQSRLEEKTTISDDTDISLDNTEPVKENMEENTMNEGFMEDEMNDGLGEQEMGQAALKKPESMTPERSSNGEETIISPGTVIDGSITSDSALSIKGVVNGDVASNGKLTITGKVSGDVTAGEIYLNTSRLEGDLTSEGSVKIDVGTVIVGEIKSESLVIAGAVKGSAVVEGPVIVDSTAVVKGDISGKSIQINSGAVIDGHCSLTNAEVDLDSFFE